MSGFVNAGTYSLTLVYIARKCYTSALYVGFSFDIHLDVVFVSLGHRLLLMFLSAKMLPTSCR